MICCPRSLESQIVRILQSESFSCRMSVALQRSLFNSSAPQLNRMPLASDGLAADGGHMARVRCLKEQLFCDRSHWKQVSHVEEKPVDQPSSSRSAEPESHIYCPTLVTDITEEICYGIVEDCFKPTDLRSTALVAPPGCLPPFWYFLFPRANVPGTTVNSHAGSYSPAENVRFCKIRFEFNQK